MFGSKTASLFRRKQGLESIAAGLKSGNLGLLCKTTQTETIDIFKRVILGIAQHLSGLV